MMDLNTKYLPLADELTHCVLTANATEPYDHEEYERYLRCLRAALLLLTAGDTAYAEALEDAFHNSTEEISSYVRRFTRVELIELAHVTDCVRCRDRETLDHETCVLLYG